MANLQVLLSNPSVGLEEIESHLDSLSRDDRIAQVVALDRGAQERLWVLGALAKAPMDLAYFVPPDAAKLRPFPFEGRNSLPLFTRFRKVFYRSNEGPVGGYNDSPASWLIGPGYYVARETPGGEGPVVVDYMDVPQSHPQGWPEIKRNEVGLTRFVYGFTQDFLRRISKDVVIGRAYRRGEKPMPNWFVLCRS